MKEEIVKNAICRHITETDQLKSFFSNLFGEKPSITEKDGKFTWIIRRETDRTDWSLNHRQESEITKFIHTFRLNERGEVWNLRTSKEII